MDPKEREEQLQLLLKREEPGSESGSSKKKPNGKMKIDELSDEFVQKIEEQFKQRNVSIFFV